MPNVSRRRLLGTVGGAAPFTVVLCPFPALADLLDTLFGHSEREATKPITPNDEFYVTSYRSPPTIRVSEWPLSVTGLVERPIVLTDEQLVGRPTAAQIDTLDGGGFEVRNSRFSELRTPNFELRIASFSHVAHFTRHGLWRRRTVLLFPRDGSARGSESTPRCYSHGAFGTEW